MLITVKTNLLCSIHLTLTLKHLLKESNCSDVRALALALVALVVRAWRNSRMIVQCKTSRLFYWTNNVLKKLILCLTSCNYWKNSSIRRSTWSSMTPTVNVNWIKISSFNCLSNRHLTVLCLKRSNCKMSNLPKKLSNLITSLKLSMIKAPLNYARIMKRDCNKLSRLSRCKIVHLKCNLLKTWKWNSLRSENKRKKSIIRESRNSSKSLS